MSKHLTAIAIAKLKPGPNRYEIPDAGQRGLLVVVFPSGKKSFIVRYRFGAIKRKLTLGDIGLAAARKAAADALYEVHQGRDPSLAKQATKAKAAITRTETVPWLCEQYLQREGGKLRTMMSASAPWSNWSTPRSATCRWRPCAEATSSSCSIRFRIATEIAGLI